MWLIIAFFVLISIFYPPLIIIPLALVVMEALRTANDKANDEVKAEMKEEYNQELEGNNKSLGWLILICVIVVIAILTIIGTIGPKLP